MMHATEGGMSHLSSTDLCASSSPAVLPRTAAPRPTLIQSPLSARSDRRTLLTPILRKCSGIYKWDGFTQPGSFSPGQVRQWMCAARAHCGDFTPGVFIEPSELTFLQRMSNSINLGVSDLVDLAYANAQLHVDFTLDDEDRIYLRQHIRFTLPILGSSISTRWRLVLSQQLGAFTPETGPMNVRGNYVWDFIPLLIPDFLQPGTHHILRIAKLFVASESNRVNPCSSHISNVTQRQRLPAGGRGLFPHTLYEFNEHELVQRVGAVCFVLFAVCCVLCAVCCALCACACARVRRTAKDAEG